ncbi:hypothetical protein WA158_004430 [Blastocystis sp. Blastoise]
MKGDTIQQIEELESKIEKSVQNTNDIKELLKFLAVEKYGKKSTLAAIHALRRTFTRILDNNYLRVKKLGVSKEVSQSLEEFRVFLIEQYKLFLTSIIDLVNYSDETIRIASLRTLFVFISKGGYESKNKKNVFNVDLYTQLLKKLLSEEFVSEDVQNALSEEYFIQLDICQYTYRCILCILKEIMNKHNQKNNKNNNDFLNYNNMNIILKHIFYIFSLIDMKYITDFKNYSILVSTNKNSNAEKDISQLKITFQETWIYILKLPLEESAYTYILINLSELILPYCPQPLLLTDFLKDSYKLGGYISVLSLYSLFLLMNNYNLKYDNYYTQLYELTTPDTFLMKHRERFYELLVVSLRSTYIAEYIVVAFVKKLTRIALISNPNTCLFITSLLPELFAYHSYLSYLIDQKTKRTVTDILSIRKPLPFVNVDELEKMKNDEEEKNKKLKEKEEEEDIKIAYSDDEEEEEEKKIRYDIDESVETKEDKKEKEKENKKEKSVVKTIVLEEEKKEEEKPIPSVITGSMSTLDIIRKAKEIAKNRSQKRVFEEENNTSGNNNDNNKHSNNNTTSTSDIIKSLNRKDNNNNNSSNSNTNATNNEQTSKKIINGNIKEINNDTNNDNNNDSNNNNNHMAKRIKLASSDDYQELLENYKEIDHYLEIEKEMKPISDKMTQLYEIKVLMNHYDPEVAKLANQMKSTFVKTRVDMKPYFSRTYKQEFDKYFDVKSPVPHEFKIVNGVFKEGRILSQLYDLSA